MRGFRALVQRLAPDAFWTLANNVVSVLGGLAAVKLISALVPATDYGSASLVLGVVALLTQFVVVPLLTAQLRLYFDHAHRDTTATFLKSIEPTLIRSALVMGALYVSVALAYRFAGESGYLRHLGPALLLIAVTPHANAAFNLLEARRRYRSLAVAQSLGRAAPALFLGLLFVAPIPRSDSVILAQGLALGLVFALYSRRATSAPILAEGRPAAVDGDPSRGGSDTASVKGLGWTLYAFNVVVWVLTTSDRYLIAHFWSEAQVGVYAINYGFWSMPYLTLNAWLETFTRARLFGRAAAADRAGIRRIVLGRLGLAALFGSAITILLLAFGRPLAVLVLGAGYWQGMRLAMLIAGAHFLYALGNSFYSLFIAAKRVEVLLQTAIVSATVGVATNLLLVPRISILGAGLGALAAFTTWTLLLAWRSAALLSRSR